MSGEFRDAGSIQASIDSSPFNAFCGLRVESLDLDLLQLSLSMPSRPEMERLGGSGQWHGGPLACLVDTAGCYACMMALGHGVPTINFRIDYLRPAVETKLTAIATVRKAGRSVTVADVDVLDDQGRLIAVGRGTYSSRSG